MTTVTWMLDDVGDGTRLTMQHEGLGQGRGCVSA